MFDFYHRILGATIDEPREEHVNRFGGSLTHLRAGTSYIDLLAYDTNHLSEDGKVAVAKMHAGGVGTETGTIDDVTFSSDSSTMDHLCLRVEPFNEQQMLKYLEGEGATIILSGGKRLGADGVGPSIYVRDPEGNVIELKGSPYQGTISTEEKTDTTTPYATKRNDIHSNDSETLPSRVATTKSSQSLDGQSDTINSATDTDATIIPVTPCIRICRYNSSFYSGQVCIGCFREAYEIQSWQSMGPGEKALTLMDAIDRCNDDNTTGEDDFDGAISKDELARQYEYWSEMAKK